MEQVLELLDKMQLERENTEYKQPLIKAIELTMIKCLRMEIEKLESIPHERVVRQGVLSADEICERDTILMDLRQKRYNFLDKGKFGRAEILGDLIKGIERGKITDYTYLDSVGIDVEREPTKSNIIRDNSKFSA